MTFYSTSVLSSVQTHWRAMELYCTVYHLHILLILIITVTVTETSTKQPCKSPQYIEFGKTGILDCSFNENIFLLVWYDSTDFTDIDPVLSYKKSVKSGVGYTTGEYDIYSNGSLIINTVGLEHDHYFTVVMTNSSSDDIIPFTVRAIVIVKPFVDFPVIDRCDNHKSLCFMQLEEDQNITCSVRAARPASSLRWIMRTDNGDKNISYDVSIYPDGIGYSTFATVANSFYELPELALLVCISENDLPSRLSNKESSILVQNNLLRITYPYPVPVFVEYKSPLKLSCDSRNVSIVMWTKRPTIDDYATTTIVASIAMNKTYTNPLGDYYMDDKGSLMTDNTEVYHEGVYICSFGNGLAYVSNAFRVTVFVQVYPSVDGCEHQQNCVLEKKHEDYLTCRVLGARPLPELEWNIFPTRLSSKMTFSDFARDITTNGDFFDISLTAKYRLKDISQARLTVQCKASSITEYPIVLTTNLDVLFLGDDHYDMYTESTSINTQKKSDNSHNPWAVIAVVSVVVNIISLLIGLMAIKARKNRKMKKDLEINRTQIQPLFTNSDPERDLSGKMELFITQVKGTYEDMYAAIQPVPFILDKMYSVNDLFVENGVESMRWMHSKSEKGTWERLCSYNDMFKDEQLQSKRYILEGGPGYGKSTLALKLAYDWCSCDLSSPLKDVDIFILLKLRQMGGRITIPKAIKTLLLPEDSQLSEDDITNILRSCTSVVLVLDGYDEYPDSENGDNTDVKKIIRRDIFQQVTVVLATRSYCLPKEYAAQTKRIRLTGFDETCRNKYISKAVVGNNISEVERLNACLNENPVLKGLCQVPLFFALFAHITYERTNIQTFTSVTSFFRYIISCVYGHAQNKSKGVSKQTTGKRNIKVDHSRLDKEAFLSLNENKTRGAWMKDELREQIGNECYDQFIDTGIIVNEKVINFVDYPDVLEYEHIQHTEEVRFYHKLFCEWYAAYYLSKMASEYSLEDLNKALIGFNPIELQYLFRFACGMNPKAATNIIKHLKQVDVPNEILILCIIEQTGNVTSILDAVKDLCLLPIDFRMSDSMMTKLSITQLLEIASTQNIRISCLRLWDCFGQDKEATSESFKDIKEVLTRVIGISSIEIYENDGIVQEADVADIIAAMSTCVKLKSVKFLNCFMPFIIKGTCKISFEVLWCTKYNEWYTLDILSGKWKTYVDPCLDWKKTVQTMGNSHYLERSQYDKLIQQV